MSDPTKPATVTITDEDIATIRLIAQTIEDGGWNIAALKLIDIAEKLERLRE